MKIRVLGCSGSMAAGSRTTSFLVDHDLLIDAGTGLGDLTLDELEGIDDILVSHAHLDHVLGIPLLADGVSRRRSASGRGAIRVHALPATLEAMRRHLFNGVIWPDFTRLPHPERPMIAFHPIAVGQVLSFGERRVEVLSALHTVPAVGFAVHRVAGAPAWVYTGDTGPNPALWARLATLPCAHLVIETAFGDDEADLAALSRHLCPSRLGDELKALRGWAEPPMVHITHIKPGEVDAVMSQIAALALPWRVGALVTGQVIDVD